MSGQWKPGDVAMVAFVHKAKPEAREEYGRCFWDSFNGEWVSARGGRLYPGDLWDIDARPLVVIDPEDAEAVTRLAELVSEHDRGGKGEQWIADVAAALREFANPTPPKPDEPQGLGAVVVDSDGYYWVYTGHRDIDDSRWWMCGTVSKLKFDAIAAVEVLSEGVTP